MIVGLTGGIGSGKSTVAKLFALMGCAVFNSDDAAKAAYGIGEVREQVESLLGPDAYTADGNINRARIAGKVFSDTGLLAKLNAIIHPAVGRAFRKFISENEGKIIVKESALLFEADIAKDCDRVVVVEAPDDMRVSRVMARDGVTGDEVLKRMKSQLPQQLKIDRADFVVHNGRNDMLIPQVELICAQLQRTAIS